jgi:hypothetical protein
MVFRMLMSRNLRIMLLSVFLIIPLLSLTVGASSPDDIITYNSGNVRQEDYDQFLSAKPALDNQYSTAIGNIAAAVSRNILTYRDDMSRNKCNEILPCETVYEISLPIQINIPADQLFYVLMLNSSNVTQLSIEVGQDEEIVLHEGTKNESTITTIDWSSFGDATITGDFYIRVTGNLKSKGGADNVIDFAGGLFTYWEYVAWEYNDDTVRHYSFDADTMIGTNVVDSANNQNGTTSGSPTVNYTTVSHFNEAVDFDGFDDYVNIGDTSTIIDEMVNFSIAWYMVNDNFSSWKGLMGYQNGQNIPHFFIETYPNASIDVQGTYGGQCDRVRLRGNESFVSNREYQFVFSYDFTGLVATLFTNTSTGFRVSREVPIYTTCGDAIGHSKDFFIGDIHDLGDINSDGTIDHVGIFNRTLNESEMVDYFSRSYPFTSSACSYGGSGDWEVDLADNCEISSTVDIGSNKLIISGDAGSFTIKSGAIVKVNDIAFTPDDFDGDASIIVESGGQLQLNV